MTASSFSLRFWVVEKVERVAEVAISSELVGFDILRG
jgi:hypothetical protein